MRKNKNMKKRTIYTVLLIVIAVLVVGYAVLSSALNIFGGLGIIPGDLGWGVKWSNLEVNSESNATVNTAPTLANNDTSVNFVVTLDQPGKFYEFTVDAVNTGTMDAMIDGVNTTIYNSEDEEVYPDYLNYSVEYANGVIVTPGHLLRAGESVKYKVRIEFSNDITVDDLPTQEEQLRFEFGVTYIQADESAYEPGSNNLPEITNAIEADDNLADGTWYRINSNNVELNADAADLGYVFANQTDIPNGINGFALKHVVSGNKVVSVGYVMRYSSDSYLDLLTWHEGCIADQQFKNDLTSTFQGSCTDYGNSFSCEAGDFELNVYSDSSIGLTNGYYTCKITGSGESYCY